MGSDQPQPSRDRLLAAAKELFAKHGYEQTSTAVIVRQAGSSESQLVRYFGGKAGVLEAIFEEAWQVLNPEVEKRVAATKSGREAVVAILTLLLDAFHRDLDLASVFLFEGRRIRGDEPTLSRGFTYFLNQLGGLIRKGQEDGSFHRELDPAVMLSAMVGAAEGMVRDRLVAEKIGARRAYDPSEVRRVFEAMVGGLGAPPRQ